MIAGFGFRSGATADSLREAYDRAAQGRAVTTLATADDKASVKVFRIFAATLNLPVIPVAADALTAAETTTQSAPSQTHRNTGSVAEAAALTAAGPNARLIAPRSISHDRMATCAIATGDPE